MKIGEAIRKIREARGLSQKQVALALEMDQAQYSRIENGKHDPSFTLVTRMAQALHVNISELLAADEVFQEVQSADKSVVEKVRLIEALEEQERKALYTILDAMVVKKRMKIALHQLADQVG